MTYKNPILRGMNPDPSICRVGADYYLVTSTFEYFPAIPVYHSHDLVNWTQIGNAVERPEQLPLEKAKASSGIWAPTIRYHNGKFYITATFDGVGNFIISSDCPEAGWSNPVWVAFDGIDPSMFFEDDRLYYCANDCGRKDADGEGISLAEINPLTGGLIGVVRRIWEGTGGGFLEAPHLYHIGSFYYLLSAEGGTNENHMITLARSRDIWGPYESCPANPILTNRNDTSKQISCVGHGDLADDTEGNLWLVHLGTRPIAGLSHLGRETFLMPAALENGWLAVGQDRKSHMEVSTPLIKAAQDFPRRTYDFSRDVIGCEWLFRRIPSPENYAPRRSAPYPLLRGKARGRVGFAVLSRAAPARLGMQSLCGAGLPWAV
ncbi:MAG: glycoside hydrolase family 43 protein [Roseburia sp.]|nr:glycoside hydrolase family 43 protein [Roseburia sp.]